MKKAKLIKTNKKEEKQIEKDCYSLKSLLLIVILIIVVLGVFYFITTLVVKPINYNDLTNNSTTEIESTKITLNNLLNRKEKEYYVIATKESENSQANYLQLYNNYIKAYSSKENALPFYNVDLKDALNKNYIGESLNISDDISELKLNDEVLFKVKDGKIEEYFVGRKEILNILVNLKEG